VDFLSTHSRLLTREGITTDLDRTKVANMVRRYMENERTM
jgi:hypothetical protein